jgi:hypothetical protein
VLESAVIPQAFVERVLPRVTEWRMAEIVRQADGFRQRLIELERARDRACDLRDLERVRDARAIQIALVIDEHLRLVNQPPEGARMDDAIAIALVLGAKAWRSFLVNSTPGMLGSRRVRRQRAVLTLMARRILAAVSAPDVLIGDLGALSSSTISIYTPGANLLSRCMC